MTIVELSKMVADVVTNEPEQVRAQVDKRFLIEPACVIRDARELWKVKDKLFVLQSS